LRPFVGLGQGELSVDMKNYLKFTEYFKKALPADSVGVPYNYRPLAPWVSSKLPFNSFTSLNIFNFISILASLFLIFLFLRRLGFSFSLSICGCILYCFSFPVFYYGTNGGIDTVSMMMIFAVVTSALYRKHYLLPLLIILGALTKENIIVSLPFVLFLYLRDRTEAKQDKSFFTFFGLAILAYILTVLFTRVAFSSVHNYVWSPAFHTVIENVTRPKTYLSFLLAFGLLGTLSCIFLFRNIKFSIRNEYFPYAAGIITSLALCVYSVVAAYSDGRFFWTAYPYLIPLSIKYIEGILGVKKNSIDL
jgi:hypothetical protein